MSRVLVEFIRRLWLPLLLFATFNLFCVAVYVHLEGLRWQDALFWITHPHSIHYGEVRDATKFFAMFVFLGVFAFQIWIAERVFITIFSRHGREVWLSMVNNIGIDRMRDHFIICGYGQVGRTVVSQLVRLRLPFVLIETNEGIYRQLLSERIPVVQGDAKQHDILRAAGIERAQGICIVIDNDADNLYVTITAKSLNPEIKIITRAGQERYAQAMRNSGADSVFIPEHEGGILAGKLIEQYAGVQPKAQ